MSTKTAYERIEGEVTSLGMEDNQIICSFKTPSGENLKTACLSGGELEKAVVGDRVSLYGQRQENGIFTTHVKEQAEVIESQEKKTIIGVVSSVKQHTKTNGKEVVYVKLYRRLDDATYENHSVTFTKNEKKPLIYESALGLVEGDFIRVSTQKTSYQDKEGKERIGYNALLAPTLLTRAPERDQAVKQENGVKKTVKQQEKKKVKAAMRMG